MIITQCVILARASGKLIFIHENKVFDCYFSLNLAETKTKLKRYHCKLVYCSSNFQFFSFSVYMC